MNHESYGFTAENQVTEQVSLRRKCYIGDISFASTSDFAGIAKNHCCATMLTNLVILLRFREPEKKGKPGKQPQNAEILKIFTQIHEIVGNGPVLTLKGRTGLCLSAVSLPCSCHKIKKLRRKEVKHFSSSDNVFLKIRRELMKGHPCALLVAVSPLDMHWILAIGFAEYESGVWALRISDSWHRQLYLYRPDAHCRILSAWAFTEEGES